MNALFPGQNDRLVGLTDEQLLWLIQIEHSQAALSVLVERHLNFAMRLMLRWHKRDCLTQAALGDAQQTGRLAVLEAIRTYNLLELLKPQPCSFQSHLYRLLQSRFEDLRKGEYRHERCLDRSVVLDQVLDRRAERCHVAGKYRPWSAPDWRNPLAVVQARELWKRIEQIACALSPNAVRMLEELRAGTPLRVIARMIGLSLRAAKRLRLRLFTALRAGLKGELDY